MLHDSACFLRQRHKKSLRIKIIWFKDQPSAGSAPSVPVSVTAIASICVVVHVVPSANNTCSSRILDKDGNLVAHNFKELMRDKNRGHFLSDEAASKLLFLALRNIEKDWKTPPITWKQAANQFAILFGERFTNALN